MDHLGKYSRAGNEGGGGEGSQALLVAGDPGQPLVASTPACGVTVRVRGVRVSGAGQGVGPWLDLG